MRTLGYRPIVAAVVFALCMPVGERGRADVAAEVDPLIGSGGGNNVHPGAVVPRGMVHFGPDNSATKPGGYQWGRSAVDGFSLIRFNGRGVPCLNDVALMPSTTFAPAGIPAGPSPRGLSDRGGAATPYRLRIVPGDADMRAEPGYYRVRLDPGGQNILVETTATPRTGYARITFPASSAGAGGSGTVLVAAGHSATGNVPAGTGIAIDPANRLVTGQAQSGGCNGGTGGPIAYTVYFAARFDRPFASWGTWNGTEVHRPETRPAVENAAEPGAWLNFDTRSDPVVRAKIGVSWVSVANALDNLERENPPAGYAAAADFDGVRDRARQAWNDALGRVRIEGGTPAQRRVFYSGLYRTQHHPAVYNDANGAYLGFDGRVHTVPPGRIQYHGFPTWDTYRSHIALLAMIDPATGDMMQSMIDFADQDPAQVTCLPRWQIGPDDSRTMIGDGGAILAATAHAHGVTGFDAERALALSDSAGSQPRATLKRRTCREALGAFLAQGYVPVEERPHAASITLEYASADFATAQLARALGRWDLHYKYARRAAGWRALWNPAQASPAGYPYTGYLVGRHQDGTFPVIDARLRDRTWIEGNAAQYLWMVPHDRAGLARLLGGSDAAVLRLRDHFGSSAAELNAGTDSFHAYLGNQVGHQAPAAFAQFGDPASGAEVWRRLLVNHFRAEPFGYPGNEDGGSMSALMVLASLGLNHAIPGVAGFAVGSPRFPLATLSLANGRTLTVRAPNASDTNIFVRSLSIDGVAHDSAWLPWSAIAHGAELAFSLAPQPGNWGTSVVGRAPSFAVPDVGYDRRSIADPASAEGADADGLGNSYIEEALASRGMASGAIVSRGGMSLQWPASGAGVPDSIAAAGQSIPLPPGARGTRLGVLGAAFGGASMGPALITYADGSTRVWPDFGFSDWSRDGGAAPLRPGERVAARMPYRLRPDGSREPVASHVFLVSTPVVAGKVVKSLTLPENPAGGRLRVFAVGVNDLSLHRNNIGISADQEPELASFDRDGNSYSADDLRAAGFAPGSAVTLGGTRFRWPDVGATLHDNVVARGQTLVPSSSGGTLHLLGAASDTGAAGSATGTGTLRFSDGSTQPFTLAFADWTAAAPLPGAMLAVGGIGSNSPEPAAPRAARAVFKASLPLPAGRNLVGVVLPATVLPAAAALHVFAIAVD